MDKLATVLIPLYNKELYLRQALDSVFMQKVDFNYEVLIIDDCSTDASCDIVQEYLHEYPDKITFIKNEKNLRTLATSLKGYGLIETKYFTVLDPDDYWITEDKMQNAVNFLETHDDFTIYMTNTYLHYIDKDKKVPYLNSKSVDFAFDNIGSYIAGHTSATFFRNIFKCEELKELEKFIGTENEISFEGDSFRNFLHLRDGKCHYENMIESVYRINNEGIWSKLSSYKQNIENARLFFNFFEYFGRKHKDYFVTKGLSFLNVVKDNFAKLSIDYYKLFLVGIKYKNEFNLDNINDKKCYFCFFLPSKIVGGYEFLFINMAKFLSEEMGYNVFYVDYADGFAASQLVNTGVQLICYRDGMELIDIDEPLSILLPITWAYQTPQFKNKKTSFIFYVAHPNSIEWLGYRSGMNNASINKFINSANNNGSLVYMDGSCYEKTQRQFDFKLNKDYLPVFIPKSQKMQKSLIKNTNEINITWLGRLDTDKIYSVINLLDNFLKFTTPLKKRIHIIGEGNGKNLIDISKYESDIDIIFTSTLIGDELEDYLINNTDILYAMGTSLLTGACMGIPSVLTLLSDNYFEDDIFINLYDMKDYNLGLFKEQISDEHICSFSQTVENTRGNADKAMQSYKYYIENHNVYLSIYKLLEAVPNTKYKLLEAVPNTKTIENKSFFMRLKSKIKRIFK